MRGYTILLIFLAIVGLSSASPCSDEDKARLRVDYKACRTRVKEKYTSVAEEDIDVCGMLTEVIGECSKLYSHCFDDREIR